MLLEKLRRFFNPVRPLDIVRLPNGTRWTVLSVHGIMGFGVCDVYAFNLVRTVPLHLVEVLKNEPIA